MSGQNKDKYIIIAGNTGTAPEDILIVGPFESEKIAKSKITGIPGCSNFYTKGKKQGQVKNWYSQLSEYYHIEGIEYSVEWYCIKMIQV